MRSRCCLPSLYCSLLAVGLAWGSGSALAATAVQVNAVRLWAGPENTRVVLDLSAPAAHEVFTLANPDRVVVDIPSGRLSLTEQSLPTVAGVVRDIRYAHRDNGTLRIVMDLTQPVSPRSFLVEPNEAYGHRLVVDLGLTVAATAATDSTRTVVKKRLADSGAGRDIVVAIDAGHGGEDPGAIGRRGTREKDVTLAIARRLKTHIDSEPGMRAVLTRDGDYFVSLRDRIVRARKHQADMFVSVHADAVRDRRVAGSSVYVLSSRGASDEAARWLAERENAADLVGGVSLDDKDDVLASVLLDLSQGASMSASVDAAEYVLKHLNRVGSVRRGRVQHAGFVVLKSPDIPSLLVETAFISNPGEETRLRDRTHQDSLAVAILGGVREYFFASPPPGTRLAQLKAEGAVRTSHVISRGDTLSAIAEHYRVSLAALRAANGLRSDRIAVGQVLEIPRSGMAR